MSIPADLKYTDTHEWIRIEGDLATVGITDHAQSELGDIVFVELPRIGQEVAVGANMGTIEAVKTVADLYAPLSGVVAEINTSLQNDAAIINQDPYNKGWIAKIKFADLPSNLLSADGYQAIIH